MMGELKNGHINKSFPDSRQAWGIVLIFVTSTILMVIIAFSFRGFINRNSFVSLIYSFIPSAITIAFMLSKNNKLLKTLIFDWEIKHWYRYISFLLIVSGIILFSYSLISIIKINSILWRLKIISTISGFLSIKMFFAIVILAPVFEEFIFRGVILNGFLTRYSPLKAILLSSIIFSVVHFNPIQSVNAFFLGLIIGWYYFITRNLLTCIIIHSLYNLVSFFFMMYFVEKSSAIKYDVNESLFLNHHLLLFFFIAVAVINIGISGLNSTFRHTRVETDTSKF